MFTDEEKKQKPLRCLTTQMEYESKRINELEKELKNIQMFFVKNSEFFPRELRSEIFDTFISRK
jgi:hypothetical protein